MPAGKLWVLPSSPHLLPKMSPSQVAADCNLLPAGTAGNGCEQRRFQPTSPQEIFLRGLFLLGRNLVFNPAKALSWFPKRMCAKVGFLKVFNSGVVFMTPKGLNFNWRPASWRIWSGVVQLFLLLESSAQREVYVQHKRVGTF